MCQSQYKSKAGAGPACYRDWATFLQMEYAVVSWSHWTKGDRECLEKVQWRAVSMVTNLRARTYEGKLLETGMTSVQGERGRT